MLRLRVCGQMFSALPVDCYLCSQEEAYRTDDKKGDSAPAHLALLLQTCHTPCSLLTKFTPICSRRFTRGSFKTHQLSLPPAVNKLGDSIFCA